MQKLKDFVPLWIEALRSKKYPQIKGNLRKQNGFCCLGVLCDATKTGSWDRRFYKTSPCINLLFNDGVYFGDLPANEFELIDTMGTLSFTSRDKPIKSLGLADLNDSGFTFDQIADVIEYEWGNYGKEA